MANNRWWPDVSDKDSAQKAIMNGFGAAAFVATVTAVIALISIFLHKPILGIDGLGLFDATIFAAIAFGIYRKSRATATDRWRSQHGANAPSHRSRDDFGNDAVHHRK